MSSPDRNVPMLNPIEMSPFSIFVSSHFISLSSSLECLHQRVGLGRSEALRSPKGGAFRAKRRPRPTPARGPLRTPCARDGPAPASTSSSPPRLAFSGPWACWEAGAPGSLSSSDFVPGSESRSSRPPTRTPLPCSWRAHDAGSAAPPDRSGSHPVPPSHCSAPVSLSSRKIFSNFLTPGLGK